MTDTFTWRVNAAVSAGGGEFTTAATKFGDGYSQEVPLGINNEVRDENVTFAGSRAECEEVLAFLRAKAGAESFFWTPPLGTQGLYRCKGWKYSYRGDVMELTLPFKQVFEP